MKVHHIILLVWFIVLVFWAVNQVAESNRRADMERERLPDA